MIHRTTRAAAGALALAAAMAAPAHGQLVYKDFFRVDQSDVTGVSITSVDLLGLEAGSVASFECVVAWGVRTTANDVERDLASGTLRGAGAGAGVVRRDVQDDLLSVLLGQGGGGAGERLAAGLAPAADRHGARAAAELVRRMDGLLAVTGRMDPARPGQAAPSRLHAAVSAYDAYLDASSEAFLASPPDEVAGVQAVLSRLVAAAIEHHGRTAMRAGGGALSCAPPPPPPSPAPRTPEETLSERPISACVVGEQGPERAYGMVDLETGDTTAVVRGERLPWREAYPAARTASAERWYVEDRVIELGGRKWVRFGVERELPPGSVRPFARHGAVTMYAAPGVTRPSAVYVPVDECLFREYRPQEIPANG